MSGQTGEPERLRAFLTGQPALELAILVNSRADGRVREDSDWDIAIQWPSALGLFDTLARSETLRRDLAAMLVVAEEQIDLIDLPNARLAMRAVVAEDGVLLKGEDSLTWNHFLARTWREIEDYEWEGARAGARAARPPRVCHRVPAGRSAGGLKQPGKPFTRLPTQAELLSCQRRPRASGAERPSAAARVSSPDRPLNLGLPPYRPLNRSRQLFPVELPLCSGSGH